MLKYLYLTAVALLAMSNFTCGQTPVPEPSKWVPEQIVKDGNENKSYVIMLSADWCMWCQVMKPKVLALRNEGYIVYVFNISDPGFEDYAKRFKVATIPTFIIFNKGKEVAREKGRITMDWFHQHLEKFGGKPEQPDDDQPGTPHRKYEL